MLSLLGNAIPNDHSSQVNSRYYVEQLPKEGFKIGQVLDLGCGTGNSIDYFKKKIPGIRWVGLDIEESPEIESHIGNSGEFQTFDGIHIPFDDDSFELIYCNQVFEHVRDPIGLLKEVYRVLRPDGHFVGSVSHLEPCHSSSMWNFTPYGFRLLIEESGLHLAEARPSIDAITLIVRYGFGRPRFFSRWWEKESPLNRMISIYGKAMHKSHSFINAVKLLFCGQFCFLVCKKNYRDGQ